MAGSHGYGERNDCALAGIGKKVTVEQIENAAQLLSHAGVKVFAFMMLYQAWEEDGKLCWETSREVDNSLRFMRRLFRERFIHYMSWQFCTPMPGAPLYAIAKKYNLYKGDEKKVWETYDEHVACMRLPGISARTMQWKIKKGILLKDWFILALGRDQSTSSLAGMGKPYRAIQIVYLQGNLMFVIPILVYTSLFIAGLIGFYHLILLLTALFMPRRCLPHVKNPGALSFAIVIPAHNEEKTIVPTLRSCAELDYPKDKYAVYVVADNCTDLTAKAAAACDAICLERTDPERQGKGYALEFAFPKVLSAGHDAVIVLDADCHIDRHALRVFSTRLNAGDRVLQVNDAVANPEDSSISYVLAVANVLENELFQAPKDALGLTVAPVGCGMVFHRDVLLQYPWRSQALCEDTEYSLLLERHGINIRFVPEVRVDSDFPVHREQFIIQRRRWIKGGVTLGWTHGLKLMWEGIWTRRWRLIDAGFML